MVARRKISAEIRQWRKGKTTIIITHDINAIELHDYLYILESGAIVQKGFRRDLEFRSGPFQNFLLNISTFKTFPENRRASPPIPLTIIPELNTEFWNKSNSDLTISPSFCSTGSVYSNSTTYFTEADRRAFSVNSPSRDGFQKASVSGFSPQSSPNRPTARRPGLLRPEWNVGRMQRSISDRSPLSAFIPASRTPSPHPSEITDFITLTPILSTFGWGSSDLGTSDVSTVAVTSSSDSDLEKDAMLPKPSEERKQTLLEILGTVWPSLKPKGRVMLVFGFLSALLHAAATPVFSFCLAQLLGVILNTNLPLSAAQKWSLIILAIVVVDTVNCYILHYFLASIGQEWAHIQRTRAFGKILLQPLAWFSEKRNGVSELTEDLEKHAEEMRNMVAKVAGYGFIGAILVVIGIAWSAACNWKLTLVGLSMGPVMAAISKGMTKASDRYEKRCNDSAQEMGGVVHEAMAAIQTVKNYSLEKYFKKQYAAAAEEGLRTGKKRCFWTGIWFGLADSAILFSTALIFYFGATLVKNHENMKDVISVFTLLLFSISSANAIINLIPQVSSTKDSAHRVLRLADLPEKSHETTGAKSPSAGDIVFTKVRFSYPDRPVLDDVSFTIKANTMVAITGASGCGKSTIVALLQRMYANTCNITLGDSLINQLSTRMLRDHIVVVPQTPAIFDDSIIQNITYGISVWKYLAVEQAAKAAGIHEFVMSLPEGYNANAMGLSTGQKRRVAIARALLRKPQVLVLDEGTVGLDVHSAEHIRKTLVKLKEEMTVVVVTHEEELMFVADKVVVIGRGKVEEEGTYQDLIAKIGPGALKALLKGNRP
jgi:ATP-binding cassette subfamily B (MDR/TAP) protein 1